MRLAIQELQDGKRGAFALNWRRGERAAMRLSRILAGRSQRHPSRSAPRLGAHPLRWRASWAPRPAQSPPERREPGAPMRGQTHDEPPRTYKRCLFRLLASTRNRSKDSLGKGDLVGASKCGSFCIVEGGVRPARSRPKRAGSAGSEREPAGCSLVPSALAKTFARLNRHCFRIVPEPEE
ncbi:MAG: hypothetical protein HW416_3907 [Chloroflexi bacterium]|nr:hypothetical protein [Chloroflexota bacterium]